MSEHPYLPRDLHLPDYVPGSLSTLAILSIFIGISTAIVIVAWIFSGRTALPKTDRLLVCWFLFTGLTHIVVEGYFVFSPEFYKVKTPCYFAEIWKEYAKGDSRYVARDSTIVAVEGITTVFVGPACLLAVFAIALRKPYSCILQLVVSACQLYGDIIYFATGYLEGDRFSSSSTYYWAYFVVANSFWIFIPTLIAYRSWKKLVALEKLKMG